MITMFENKNNKSIVLLNRIDEITSVLNNMTRKKIAEVGTSNIFDILYDNRMDIKYISNRYTNIFQTSNKYDSFTLNLTDIIYGLDYDSFEEFNKNYEKIKYINEKNKKLENLDDSYFTSDKSLGIEERFYINPITNGIVVRKNRFLLRYSHSIHYLEYPFNDIFTDNTEYFHSDSIIIIDIFNDDNIIRMPSSISLNYSFAPISIIYLEDSVIFSNLFLETITKKLKLKDIVYILKNIEKIATSKEVLNDFIYLVSKYTVKITTNILFDIFLKNELIDKLKNIFNETRKVHKFNEVDNNKQMYLNINDILIHTGISEEGFFNINKLDEYIKETMSKMNKITDNGSKNEQIDMLFDAYNIINQIKEIVYSYKISVKNKIQEYYNDMYFEDSFIEYICNIIFLALSQYQYIDYKNPPYFEKYKRFCDKNNLDNIEYYLFLHLYALNNIFISSALHLQVFENSRSIPEITIDLEKIIYLIFNQSFNEYLYLYKDIKYVNEIKNKSDELNNILNNIMNSYIKSEEQKHDEQKTNKPQIYKKDKSSKNYKLRLS